MKYLLHRLYVPPYQNYSYKEIQEERNKNILVIDGSSFGRPRFFCEI